MKQEENIIAIRNRDINEADKAFAEFMQKTEDCFNERSRLNPQLFSRCSATDLERVTEQILKDVCPSTPFRQSDIKLVAGHTFPDIMTTDIYGVEVKSTNKDKWTSTGSSIVESTRSKDVERIYMLFGSLGSNPPAFRCKPYQDCLSNIAVTHSPRYMIDMTLEKQENIFSKMNTDYDTFRLLEEGDKISQVRRYYIEKARKDHKVEMPWWMGDTGNPSIGISIYNDIPTETKRDFVARSFILFPSVFGKDSSLGYKEVAVWLCNHYSLLCYNMRDFFSSGGKMRILNGVAMEESYPQVVQRLLQYRERIEALLKHPDAEILKDLQDYWDFKYDQSDLFNSWINIVEKAFLANPSLKDIDIRHLIETNAKGG